MANARRDSAFFQVIGTGFHQDALSDGQTVEEIIDRYRDWHPAVVRQASETAHRLLSEDHDEAEIEAILEGFGFAFLVEPLGFGGYNAFLKHLAERLDGFIADRSPQASIIPEPEPMRELADGEIDALSALLKDNFRAGSDEEYAGLLERPAACVRAPRCALCREHVARRSAPGGRDDRPSRGHGSRLRPLGVGPSRGLGISGGDLQRAVQGARRTARVRRGV
jgi:hypothetical protein